MQIKKMETNIKKGIFFKESTFHDWKKLDKNLENELIYIYPEITFQEFLGFGGAFTDSSGCALQSVSKKLQEKIMDDYFSKEGLNYSFGRLPIASCDFSVNSYSYSHEKDLSDFSIQRDLKYIIPMIKSAQKRNSQIKFLASPWSPPTFMKSNHRLELGGKLLPEYQKTWADYLVKYVKEYQKQGIPIHYMTIQNEPNATQIWESCTYTAEEEASLLKNYLFPIFQKNHLSTKFFIWDHNKQNLWNRTYDILIQNGALDSVAGIAFHWYSGSYFENIALVHQFFPEKLLFHTEGCTGYSNFQSKDELFNAEMYAKEMIGDLNHGTNAFIDWNLILDNHGRS